MVAIVAFDHGSDSSVPRELIRRFGRSGHSPLVDGFSVLICELPLDEARDICADAEVRAAAGAADIWEVFPELRGFFAVQIEEDSVDGVKIQRRQLAKCIPGDVIVDRRATFDPGHYHWIGNEEIRDIGVVEISENYIMENYPFIMRIEDCEPINVCNFSILFCEDFSLYNMSDEFVCDGVRFYNYRQLLKFTNLIDMVKVQWDYVSKFNESSPDGHNFGVKRIELPSGFSGAFICDRLNTDHSRSVIQRVFAAAAAVHGANAKILCELNLTQNSWGLKSREGEIWRFPFRKRLRSEAPVVFNAQNGAFGILISLIRSETVSKFRKAKEDYRVLALETAADGRHSEVAALQFAQIWMAIERLIPFKEQTSAQLAHSLSALFPFCDRQIVFPKLKRLYNLRSRVVHGYNFKRDDSVYENLEYISTLFRSLLEISLNYASSDHLKRDILRHLSDGEPQPFS